MSNDFLINLEEISVPFMLDFIVETVRNNQPDKFICDLNYSWKPKNMVLEDLPVKKEFLEPYFRTIMESEWVAMSHFLPDKFLSKELLEQLDKDRLRPKNNEKHKEILKYVFQDLGKTNAFVCMGAWLTYNNKIYPWRTDSIPTLNNGLVLFFPEFIIPFCSYLSGIKRQPYKQLLLNDTVELYIENTVKKDLKKFSF